MIRTKTTVENIEYSDYRRANVTQSLSENDLTSNFEIVYDNPYGRHSSDFVVGDEVIIYADKDAAPTTKLITGIIDTVSFEGEGLAENVVLRGRDYSSRLIDNLVNTVVYTNMEVGSIVRDIISSNLTDIGSANVQSTGVTIERIAFNQIPIYDALTDLADLSNYIFYVDNDKDLHFEPAGSVSSNILLNSGNIARMVFDKTREGMYNKIWVRGDRYFSASPREIFAGNGTGSVFTLSYNPFNTQVLTSNVTPGSNLKGGVFNLVSATSYSGVDYLVNFFDRQIIFVSGTALGYSTIPNAGGSILVNYDRELPIVKYGQDNTSVAAFGPKELVIDDKSIKDPATAVAILNSRLADANPLNNIEVDLKGWYTFKPGQTVEINAPDFGLNLQNQQLIEVKYQFDAANAIAEKDIISIKIDRRTRDITDEIKDLKKQLELVQSQDRQVGDIFTRLEYGTGSLLVVGSQWKVNSRWLGSEFRLWGSNNVPPIMSGGTVRLGLLFADPEYHDYEDFLIYSGTNWDVGSGNLGSAVALGSPTFGQISGAVFKFNNNQPLTQTMWVNPNVITSTNTVLNYGRVGVAFSYGTIITNGSLKFRNTSTDHDLASGPIPIGQWTHLALSTSSSGTKGYLNGSPMFFNSSAVANTSSADILELGRRANSPSQYYSGLIDDIRIYSSQLTDQEVLAIYNGSNITTNLIGHWPANDGSGNLLYNSVEGSRFFIGSKSYLIDSTHNFNPYQTFASGGYSY